VNVFQVSFLWLLTISLAVELANGDNIYLKSFESNQIGNFMDFVRSNELVGT